MVLPSTEEGSSYYWFWSTLPILADIHRRTEPMRWVISSEKGTLTSKSTTW